LYRKARHFLGRPAPFSVSVVTALPSYWKAGNLIGAAALGERTHRFMASRYVILVIWLSHWRECLRCDFRFNQRDSRNALFSNYDPSGSKSGSASTIPQRSSPRNAPYSTYQGGSSSPYSYGVSNDTVPAGGFSAYPAGNADGRRSNDGGFRAATPNGKGQYSSAMLDELESQNDDQASEMSKKIKMLKGVSIHLD
jgi:hypothetical protein